MASLSSSFVLWGQSEWVGPSEPCKISLTKAVQPAHTGWAYSPQLLNLPDVVLDQSTNGLIAITWNGEDRRNKENR